MESVMIPGLRKWDKKCLIIEEGSELRAKAARGIAFQSEVKAGIEPGWRCHAIHF